MTPELMSLSRRDWIVLRAAPSLRESSRTPARGDDGERRDETAIEVVKDDGLSILSHIYRY